MRPNGPRGEQNYETLEFEARAAGYIVHHVGTTQFGHRRILIEVRHSKYPPLFGRGRTSIGAITDIVSQIRRKKKDE